MKKFGLCLINEKGKPDCKNNILVVSQKLIRKNINGLKMVLKSLELELFLVSARIPKISKKPLFGNSIQGSVRLIDGFIDNAEMVFGQLPGNTSLIL